MSGFDTLLASVTSTAARPFSDAVTLPREAYVDPDFAALETRRLFLGDWVCVGRLDEIPEPGDYITHRIVDTPVAVIHQRDGSLAALVTICRHRGAGLLEGCGHADRIVCPYHAWTYDLTGGLLGAPFSGDRVDLSSISLPRARTDIWEGWIYVTLDDDVAPLSSRLGSLSSRIAPWYPADHVMVWRANEVWACNWKTLAENFTESYHLFSSHRETLQPYTPTQGVHCEPGEADWNIHWMDTTRPAAKTRPDASAEARRRFPLMHIYPSHVVSTSLERGFWMSLQPEGVDRVRVLWGVTAARSMVPADDAGYAAFRDDIKRTFDAVNLEDRRIVESIARNLRSDHYRPGPLCPKERTLWEFWRYLARRLA